MITGGCDPEFFLKRNGVNVSAEGLVPGTKDKPHKLKHGWIQLDGTAVEFNTEPASSPEEFAHNVMSTLECVRELIPREYEFDFSPAVFYDQRQILTMSPQSLELGCNPDFSAYTGLANPKPIPHGRFLNMRTGSGHFAVGWSHLFPIEDKDQHFWTCCEYVKAMDLVCVSAKIWDDDADRVQLYGAPGAFRPKPFGVEYRPLSNAWLKYPALWPWLFDLFDSTFQRMMNDEPLIVTSGMVPYKYTRPLWNEQMVIYNHGKHQIPLLGPELKM